MVTIETLTRRHLGCVDTVNTMNTPIQAKMYDHCEMTDICAAIRYIASPVALIQWRTNASEYLRYRVQ